MSIDVISRHISLTAWGRLYGFDKATTSRPRRTGKLPPELDIERLPNGRYYVVVPPENDGRCIVYARVSSSGQREDLDRQVGRVVEWATERGHRPDEVVKGTGSGLNGNRRRLRALKALLDLPAVSWTEVSAAWYDGTTRTVELTSQTAVWYRSGKPPVPLRWVLVRDPQGEFTPQALLCTDPSADPAQILEWFVLRRRLEVTFQEVRAHLGVETPTPVVGSSHCPYYTNPDGTLLLDHPGGPSSAATTTLGPSHSGLVRQAVADLRGCHRSGAPPPVAGV